MARQAVIDALNSTLGRYIIDLDTPSLSLSLKSGGKITFPHGLKLDADAINRDYLQPDSEYEEDQTFSSKASARESAKDANGGFFGSFRRPKKQQQSQRRPSFDNVFSRKNSGMSSSPLNDSFHRAGGERRRRKSSSSIGYSDEPTLSSSRVRSETANHTPAAPTAPAREQPKRSSRSCSTSPKDYLNEDWIINVNAHNRRRKFQRRRLKGKTYSSFIDGLSLPNNVRVKSGSIHELYIEIPWKALASRPVIVKITGVKLVLEPIIPKAKPTMRPSVSNDSLSQMMHEFDKKIGTNSSTAQSANNDVPPDMTAAAATTVTVWDTSRNGGTFGSRLMKSLPLADRFQNEMLLKKKSDEEEMVRKRRRIIMKRKDKRRRRHKHLRQIIFPSIDYRGDEDGIDMQDEGRNIAGVWSRLKSSISLFGGGNGQRSDEQFKENLRRRIFENLQLDVEGVHLQLVRAAEDEHIHNLMGFRRRKRRGSSGSVGSGIGPTEERTDNTTNGFVLGIVLEQLLIKTKNNTKPTISQSTSSASLSSVNSADEIPGNFLVKTVSIAGFGVYIEEGNNIDDEKLGTDSGNTYNSSNSTSAGIGLETVMTGGLYSIQSYVINPISFEATFQKEVASTNNNMDGADKNPIQLISLKLPHLSIVLSKLQLNLLNDVKNSLVFPVSSFAHGSDIPLYPEYRPLCSITSLTVSEWWQYAVVSILRIRGRKRQRLWVDFMVAFRKRKRYIALYCRHLIENNPVFSNHAAMSDVILRLEKRLCMVYDHLENTAPLSEHERSEMKCIEDDPFLSVEAILQWRDLVEGLIQEKIEETRTSKGRLVDDTTVLSREGEYGKYGNTESESHTQTLDSSESSSFSGIFGWALRDEAKEAEEISERDECVNDISLSPKELKDLEVQLRSQTELTPNDPSRFTTKIEFSVGFVILDVIYTQECPVAKLRLGTFFSSYELTESGSKSLMCSLSSLELEDMMAIEPVFPSVIRTVHLDPSSADGFVGNKEQPPLAFQISLESSENGERKVNLQMVALEVVAATPFFENLFSFFYMKSSISCHSPLLEYFSLLADMSSGAVVSFFQHTWEDRFKTISRWTFSINIAAPMLIIPENFESNNPSVLVIDFGRHQLQSTADVLNNHVIQTWLCGGTATDHRFDSSFSELSQVSFPTPEMAEMWRLDSTNIAVLVGTARGCEWLQHIYPKDTKESQPNLSPDLVIDPFSIRVDFVHEMHRTHEPRTFVDISMSSVNFSLTPGILARLISVWSFSGFSLRFLEKFLQSMTANESILSYDFDLEFNDSSGDLKYGMDIPSPVQSTLGHNGAGPSPPDTTSAFHLSAYIGKFVCKMEIVQGAFEVHLLSLKYSFSSLIDQSNSSRLQVGWAWFLDGLDDNREKKFVLNGLMPDKTHVKNGCLTTSLDNFDVLEHNMPSKSTVDIILIGNNKSLTLLVRFSEIFIHWYPDSVEQLMCVQEEVKNEIMRLRKPFESSSPLNNFLEHSQVENDNVSIESTSQATETSETSSLFRLGTFWQSLAFMSVKLEVTSIEVKLHRGTKDDAPYLFMGCILGIFFELNCQGETELETIVEVNRAIFEAGQVQTTLPDHRPTIFQDKAETSVFFSLRHRRENVHELDEPPKIQACTVVNISPVEISYLHSHFGYLAKYTEETNIASILLAVFAPIFDGFLKIVGAHFEQVLEMEMDELILLIPQSSKSLNVFTIRTGVGYSFTYAPYDGGGEGKLSLNGLSISCAKKKPLLSNPLDLFVATFRSPLDETGNMQVTKFNLLVAGASITFNKQQWTQLMMTLLENLRDQDLPFESEGGIGPRDRLGHSFTSLQEQSSKRRPGLIKKVEIDVRFDVISLSFCEKEDMKFPCLTLRAEKSKFLLQNMSSKGSFHVYGSAMHVEIDSKSNSEAQKKHSVLSQMYGDKSKGPFARFKLEEIDGRANLSLVCRGFQLNIYPCIFSETVKFLELPALSTFVKRSRRGERCHGGSWLSAAQKGGAQSRFDYPEKLFTLTLDTVTSRIVVFEDVPLEAVTSARCLVVQGKVTAKNRKEITNADSITGNKIEIDGIVEVFKASGPSLMDPIQVIDPTDCSIIVHSSESGSILKRDINVVSMSHINFDLSMQDALLILSIYGFLTRENIFSITSLCQEYLQAESNKQGSAINKEMRMSAVIPFVTIVFIDDFDGHDRPLFKTTIEKALLEFKSIQSSREKLHINFCTQSQFFDATSFRWSTLTNMCDASILLEKDAETSLTMVDFQYCPCCLSISKQLFGRVDRLLFLLSTISNKSSNATTFDGINAKGHSLGEYLSQPSSYGIKNLTGVTIHYSLNDEVRSEPCGLGETKFFSFGLAPIDGVGGKRVYGEDSNIFKAVTVCVGNNFIIDEFSTVISISDVDDLDRNVHTYGKGRIIVIDTETTDKATILILRSRVLVHNLTAIPFGLKVKDNSGYNDIWRFQEVPESKLTTNNNMTPFETTGIPSSKMSMFDSSADSSCSLSLFLCLLNHFEESFISSEKLKIPCISKLKEKATTTFGTLKTILHVNLVSQNKVSAGTNETVGIKALIEVSYVNENPLVDICIRPRANIQNDLSLDVLLLIPSRFIIGGTKNERTDDSETEEPRRGLVLRRGKQLQLLTSKESLAMTISFQCSKLECGSGASDWTNPLSINVPLGLPNNKLEKAESCVVCDTTYRFPILSEIIHHENYINFHHEERNKLFSSKVFSLSACNLLVDHTDGFRAICLVDNKSLDLYSFLYKCCRLTFIPRSIGDLVVVRKEFYKRSKQSRRIMALKIEETPLVCGGIESVPLRLKNDNRLSGCYAFKEILSTLTNSYKLHIISEFAIINKTDTVISFLKHNSQDVIFSIDPGETFAFAGAPTKHHIFSLYIKKESQGEYIVNDFRMDKLGAHQFKLTTQENSVGIIYVQIMSGGRNARKRVEFQSIHCGDLNNDTTEQIQKSTTFLDRSFIIRLRVDTIQILLLDSLLSSTVCCDRSLNFSFHGFQVEYCRLYRQHRRDKDKSRSQKSLFDSRFTVSMQSMESEYGKKGDIAPIISSPNEDILNLRIYAQGSDDSNTIKVRSIDCCLLGGDSSSNIMISLPNDVMTLLYTACEFTSSLWLLSDDKSAGEFRRRIFYQFLSSETIFDLDNVDISPVHIKFHIDPRAKGDSYSVGRLRYMYPPLLKYFTELQTSADVSLGRFSASNINGPLLLHLSIIKAIYSARMRTFCSGEEEIMLEHLFDLFINGVDNDMCDVSQEGNDTKSFSHEIDRAISLAESAHDSSDSKVSKKKVRSNVQEGGRLKAALQQSISIWKGISMA